MGDAIRKYRAVNPLRCRGVWSLLGLLTSALWLCATAAAAQPLKPPTYGLARVGGVGLHYMEAGSGPTLILIHGSLSDYTYWQAQMSPLARRYHVIAYSRRYNFPNNNPAIGGYSANVDAEDLTALIRSLHRGPVYLIGHSYGALTALILAARHPELVKAAVLAEAPVVSLLDHLEGDSAESGHAMATDIREHMVAPMRRAFDAGDTEQGVASFFGYVFRDPNAWARLSASDKADTIKDAREWEVMLPRGTLFPEVSPSAIRQIRIPILLMSGGKSYPFIGMTDAELARLIPGSKRVVFLDTGHQMWLQHPDECREDVETFFAEHGGPPADH